MPWFSVSLKLKSVFLSFPGCVCHAFEVTVDGVRGLSVFSNTVWGEADCFVQYHFPTVSEEAAEDSEGERMSRYSHSTYRCHSHSWSPVAGDSPLYLPSSGSWLTSAEGGRERRKN